VSLLFQVNSDVKDIPKACWEESGVTVQVSLIKYGPLPHSASPVIHEISRLECLTTMEWQCSLLCVSEGNPTC